MGQEIPSCKFTRHDFSAFHQRLVNETTLLGEYFQQKRFDSNHEVGGFEVEAWLVDKDASPAPVNELFLSKLNDPMVVHELAAFNIELNVAPQSLRANALQKLHDDLTQVWNKCRNTAVELDVDLMAIGIHPGVKDEQLSLQYMSHSKRYRALNEQVFANRQGKPIKLHIRGKEHLETTHHDAMLEAGTTSFQIHLQVNQENACRAYNAAQIVSAPLVAVSANSPFIFGLSLWDESRIPLFQQSVDLGDDQKKRVTFSDDFARGSLFSCFRENLEDFPVLIPILFDDGPEKFQHLRFHNGTIWRWNRPLIGIDEIGDPHLRIENRVVPSGPTIVDMIANAAFYWGLVFALIRIPEAPEEKIEFPVVRQNFYNAGRYGLESSIHWLDGEMHPVKSVLLHVLLPMAREGLSTLGIDDRDSEYYLRIIEERINTGQNGATWQRRWVEKYGKDMDTLSRVYLEYQHTQLPVHEWEV